MTEKAADGSRKVKGMTGGQAGTVIAADTIQGGVHVNEEMKRKLKGLFDKTSDRINLRKSMERTAASDAISKKLESGERWVVIKGCPGEGKTILGYMVMDNMKIKGWNVLYVESPDDYHFVSHCKSTDQKILYMLDDVLGAHVFDSSKLSIWQSLLNEIHENIALMSKYGRESTFHSNEYFLFIGRTNVLNQAKSFFVKRDNKDMFEENVINISEMYTAEDRENILQHHLDRKQIKIPIEDTEAVARTPGISPHGFAHCCELYADLFTELQQENIDIKLFFHNPLQFLKETLKLLFKDKEIKALFERMVKSDGTYNIDTEKSAAIRDTLRNAETKLFDVYVTSDCGTTVFSHSSVHESVTLQFGQTDPSFVIDNCNVSFLAERIKLGMGTADGGSRFIHINSNNAALLKQLVEKFAGALNERIFEVISSNACRQSSFFTKLLRAYMKTSSQKHGDEKDVFDERGFTLLHVAARCLNITAVRELVKRGADVKKKCAGETEDAGKSALHLLSENRRDELDGNLFDALITKGADINDVNRSGRTALHILHDGTVEDKGTPHMLLSHLVHKGADRYRQDRNGQLALPREYILEDSSAEAGTGTSKSPHQYTDLMQAVMEEKMDRVANMVKSGSDITETDIFGRTALHYLCLSYSVSVDNVNLLLHDTNAKDKYGNTPLHLLCRRYDIDEVEELDKILEVFLSHGGDINTYDEFGFSCLLHLRGILNTELVQVLVAHCTCLDEDNGDGMSLVHYCTIQGLDECLELIINKGADVTNAVKRDVKVVSQYVIVEGMTPLQLACRSDKSNTKTINILLDNQAGINDAGRTGSTPLYYACKGFLNFTWVRHHRVWVLDTSKTKLKERQLKICNLLIEGGADLYKQNKKGVTALHGAMATAVTHPQQDFKSEIDNLILELISLIASDQKDVARKKLNKHLDRTDRSGRTALHFLCLGKTFNLDVVDLFSTLIDLNKTDNYNNTALHYLCRRVDIKQITNRHEVLEILLRQGSDVNLYDEFGLSSLCYLREVLDENLVDVLLANCSDINSDNGDGLSLLHYVCLQGNHTYLEKLLEQVEDIDHPVSENVESDRGISVISEGETALHLACRTDNCNEDIVQTLLDKGANVNIKSKSEKTPLHLVCDLPFRFAVYTVRYILDWESLTIHTAELTHRVRYMICRLLLDEDADRNSKDKDGRPALHGDFKRRYENEEKQKSMKTVQLPI